MKVDKETLLKNRFWIMVGGIVLLLLIASTWLGTGVADELVDKKDKTDKHKQEVNVRAASPLKGKEEMLVMEDKQKGLDKQKGIVWTQDWELQNGEKDPLIVWPKGYGIEKELGTKKFGFGFEPTLVPSYTRGESYGDQVRELGKTFVTEIPGGPVFEATAFKDGWQKVLRYVKNDRGDVGWKPKAEVEEVWLAQEDFWVQRALLRSIKAANDTLARLAPVEGAAKPDKDELFRQRFANPYWQLEIAVAKKAGDYHIQGTITNVGKRRQTLGKDGRLFFLVRLNKDENSPPAILEIQSEALGVGKEAAFATKKPIKGTKDPEGIFAVEQVLETATSPVKRIDQIALGAHSHRTYQPTLLKASFSPGPDSYAVTNTAQSARPGEAPPKPSGAEVTENGLMRYRYSDRTGEVRRMPLGLVLIVDQAHVPEVHTALINSNLRFQITQSNFQHFRDRLLPADKTTEGKVAEPTNPGNLGELSIYGIASLYERPPEKKAVAEAPR